MFYCHQWHISTTGIIREELIVESMPLAVGIVAENESAPTWNEQADASGLPQYD